MEIPEDSLEAWYWWARYHILGMLAALIWGVTKTLLALSDVYYLKFPQPWLENLCADNGWKPLSEAGEEEGSSFWEPRDEMPNAVKYTGGRFVEYQSSVWRGWTKQITIGDGTEGYPRIITDITGLDPGKENGQSPLVIFVFLCVGTLVLGTPLTHRHFVNLTTDGALPDVTDPRSLWHPSSVPWRSVAPYLILC